MTALRVDVIGIGAWAEGLEGWLAMRAVLHGGVTPPASSETERTSRPSAALLPAAERRRAPDGVAVALEVAREAVAMASASHVIDASSLASVFASAQGDLAIVDYLCATLESDPTSLSPTRFHHSVHNAAAGYWSIATHDIGPASAIAAGDETFAAGLFEAATQACAEDRAVLLVAFDTPAVGLLSMAAPNTALFGIAMVMVPCKDSISDPTIHIARAPASPAIASLTIRIVKGGAASLPCASHLHALAASSPSARALALAEVIALGRNGEVAYPLSGAASSLAIRVVAGSQAQDALPRCATPSAFD